MKIVKQFIFSAAIFLASCASVVAPTGGPKDTEPPVVKTSSLEESRLFFDKNKISITFNEFFTLNNPLENILFSPPLKTEPDIQVRGKSLIIKFKETLDSNTTYNILFSDAIKDYTEGNTLPSLSYVFSTGAVLDSLSFCGEVLNAYTLQPETNVFVMLYNRFEDSLPKTTRPFYITKTDSKGAFCFSHLKDGRYKIFALQDKNSNLIFDLPEESIAFEETLIDPYYLQTDSTAIDSMKQLLHDRFLTLKMFTEEDTIQSFIKRTNPQKGMYSLIFRRAVKTLQVNTLHGNLPEYFQFENAGKDTIIWFFKSPLTDTVELELITDNRLTDTIELKPFTEPKRGRGYKETSYLSLKLLPGLYGFEPLILQSSFPLRPVDSIPYTLLEIIGRDTVEQHFSLTVPDSLVQQIVLNPNLKERTDYVILFKDSLFKDYNDLTNDSLQIAFTSKSTRDFGNLVLRTAGVPQTPIIVQLLLNQKVMVEKLLAPDESTLTFDWLQPGEYSLQWIEDLNENGVWDTGNYDLKRFPEPVHLWHKKLTIRAGWDLEEEVEFFQ